MGQKGMYALDAQSGQMLGLRQAQAVPSLALLLLLVKASALCLISWCGRSYSINGLVRYHARHTG